MTDSTIIGTRIREKRMSMGIRQTELAKAAEISPSYLNLIEHNRRRIGGRTLLKLADALEVEPTLLSEGAEATLISALHEAAGAQKEHQAELDRTEEFAGRFPGWAQLVASLHQRVESVERSLQSLTDRMAHDPHLAASLHEVISTVTAIRSTASILVDTREIEPEWQHRFYRNIGEDSRRLAEGAQALVRYLEAGPNGDAEFLSPQDEVHTVLNEAGYSFAAIEEAADPLAAVERVEEGLSGKLESDASRRMLHMVLKQYASDAGHVSLLSLRTALAAEGLEPDALARRLGVGLPLLFRRLATLPEDEVGPIGLIVCDNSGSLLFRKSIDGFGTPSVAGACALWPVFHVMRQPGAPLKVHLRQAGRVNVGVLAMAAAEQVTPPTFDQPALTQGYMLLLPERDGDAIPSAEVGITCRICPREDCAVRREPSIMSQVF
ncbi:MAG TPA: helix-turn-helix domain-containing protein [Roseovarius sp.]|nr:helix-turn-helix domain-containing protein [Roseovarius sp.]